MNIPGAAATEVRRIPCLKMMSPERDRELARLNARRNFRQAFGREAASDAEAYAYNRRIADEVIMACGGAVDDVLPLTILERDENGNWRAR